MVTLVVTHDKTRDERDALHDLDACFSSSKRIDISHPYFQHTVAIMVHTFAPSSVFGGKHASMFLSYLRLTSLSSPCFSPLETQPPRKSYFDLSVLALLLILLLFRFVFLPRMVIMLFVLQQISKSRVSAKDVPSPVAFGGQL